MSIHAPLPADDLHDRYVETVNRLVADGRDDLLDDVIAEYRRELRPRSAGSQLALAGCAAGSEQAASEPVPAATERRTPGSA